MMLPGQRQDVTVLLSGKMLSIQLNFLYAQGLRNLCLASTKTNQEENLEDCNFNLCSHIAVPVKSPVVNLCCRSEVT